MVHGVQIKWQACHRQEDCKREDGVYLELTPSLVAVLAPWLFTTVLRVPRIVPLKET